ncbi:L-gulonolactone oxidase 3 [Malania oleifera]|uniref:L-gulonolactone oxidase 3 n=1 Tax=Malania oleifera TaxID=397392 RepID=UPI0025AE8BF4|nr:L-gulonolactone oxidase 3 [Malania oleifera]
MGHRRVLSCHQTSPLIQNSVVYAANSHVHAFLLFPGQGILPDCHFPSKHCLYITSANNIRSPTYPKSSLPFEASFMENVGRLLCSILLLIRGSSLSPSHAMPPPNPVQCDGTGCTLYNAYGVWGDRNDCHVPSVTYPATEEELREAVAYAVQKKINVKVVTRFSHTIPKLACPSGNSILISTEKYNSNIEVDAANLAVTADAGVGLRELIDKVEEAGLSLVASPYWEGVSVGGLISTGSHGSSWWGKGGAVHDHVIGLSLVVPARESEGYAKIIRLEAQDPLLNAAKVSLGLLGAISKVKLSLEPGFKRSITNNFTDDAHIEEEFMGHAHKHEFADITWYPSRHTAVYRYDDRVSSTTRGDGVNDFIGFQSNPILASVAVRASEKAMENTRNAKGKCIMAATVVGYKKLVANGLKNSLIFTGYPVVGRQGKMQTSGSCLYSPAARIDTSCAWDPRIKGLFFYETTAIFPSTKFRDFIADVKKLRDQNPENFCGVDVYNGFLIRFIKASGAYLGQSEDSVVVDFNYYRAENGSDPRMSEDVWEEVEQMAFFKHGARPHWGKNRKVAFIGVQRKYGGLGKFIAAKKGLDPANVFSSVWSDELVFGKEAERGDGCALEGECVCSEDRHCSPTRGYFCKPGLVYEDARVCRHSPPQDR